MSAHDIGRPFDPPDSWSWDEEEPPELDGWELDLEPHPGHLFVSPIDESEAALMAADELVEALESPEEGFEPSDYTPDPPTMADVWPQAERATLDARLRRLGSSITELSDVREVLDLPRLSESTSKARQYAHHLLSTAKGKAALASVRAERERLAEALGISASRAARTRLGELRADAARRAA